ncbi:MAG: ABC transporter substrate-binding protein [Sphaerochaetaceae bacterium]|jgi:branched-chain amino acid transport system substrate-binding protein|nr:ABC transporter substrate-binding protein [Sphaerochaetaceae bacterium]NLO59899.1 ABC transporter substrate-binding protein [Spirochaetales bacterium]MDD2406971.1 ABC transporter substrate-binding protein [Sphaerochaetaceae bacterium]MDD3671528.1 ABC transporter substrate-binding protein [Sphaerochaetaceae bacterium]MDD4260431.1 ABC transporter substrate-binding protein [Sphaerochaetaceae bacterium]
MSTKTRIVALALVLLIASGFALYAQGQQGETKPIKIGMYADLSAGSAQWGTDCEKGGQLRVKEVNEAGGVLGRPVELIVYDIKQSPTEAVNAYTRLAQQDKVAVVNGSLLSNTSLAVSPVAERLKVPVVSRAMDERATTPAFKPEDPEKEIAVNPYFFTTQPSAFQQAAIIASYAIHELGMKTFAMLYSPANSYSQYLAYGFRHYVEKNGGTMLGSFEYQAGDLDYRAQLTRVRELNPEGLFLPGYVTENANAAKQARELGVKSVFLGNNSWYKPMDEVAGVAADGSYFPNNITFDDPKLQDFFARYIAEYGQEPRLHSFSGYDDVGVMIDAIRRAGSDDPAKVQAALAEGYPFEGEVTTIQFDPKTNRAINIPLAILKFVGASIETVDFAYYAK